LFTHFLSGAIMYCRQCGARVDASSSCSSCGAACGPVSIAEEEEPRGLFGLGRWSLATVIGGTVLIVAGIALVVLRHPTPPSAATAQSAPPSSAVVDTPAPPEASVSGFKWSGISDERIREARSALNAAIAREEQEASAHVPTSGSTPTGTKDGVRL
jgi:hypothetical protein